MWLLSTSQHTRIAGQEYRNPVMQGVRQWSDHVVMGSSTHTQQIRTIDERWVGEWVQFGLAEVTIYLAKHAAFDAYYAARGDKI